MEFKHEPVLLNECILGLNINPKGTYVDGTLGGAGHALEIVKRLLKTGILIGIDRDEEAIKAASNKLREYSNVKYVLDNHDNIKEILQNLKMDKAHGILLDLGVSSYQLDEKSRGFSYMQDSDLDMRMDKNSDLTAKDIVNTYNEENLARILFEYGEEKFSRNIAKSICKYREAKEIITTGQLAKIIDTSLPAFAKKDRGHPAKKTFQALRIEVNNEIEPLYKTVVDSINCLNQHGRLCVITFHSLEDRAVKNAYQDCTGKCTCSKDLPYCVCGAMPLGKIINKKPIIASNEEMDKNPRSKSAKLRIFERGGE